MPSSWSDSLRLELQYTGESVNLWGDKLDTVLEHIDYAIAGFLTKALTTDYSLTTANAGDDEARAAMLKFTGTGAFTVTIPSVSKAYFVWNACTGNLIISTGSGSTVTLGTGDRRLVFCDGTNVKEPGFGSYNLKDYIDAAILAATGSLPAAAGNGGKYLACDGVSWVPTVFSAAASEVRGGSVTDRAITPGGFYTAAAEVTLTSSSNSVAIDMNAGLNFTHTLTENTTLANPTNPKVGQCGFIRIIQHASSAKTFAVGSNWKRVGGAVAISTTTSATDILVYQVITSTYILYDILKAPS